MKLNKKLVLAKETLQPLGEGEAAFFDGGDVPSCPSCAACSAPCRTQPRTDCGGSVCASACGRMQCP
jgi:hypothetical protein